MRFSLPHLAVVLALLPILSGCNQSQSPAESSGASETAAATTTAAETPAKPAGPVYLTPAKLDSCTQGAIVIVHWDMRATHPEISDVEIWTGPPGNQTIFAAGGYAGEASTQKPWATPGTTFSVRNKTDGAEVASAVVEGPNCG